MNYLTAYQTLTWPARSRNPSPIEHVRDMMASRLHLPGNGDELARQLEQICKKCAKQFLFPRIRRLDSNSSLSHDNVRCGIAISRAI
ncbi:hypothetical protein TNCV_4971471 [Trichonephila clavipes]|nr:hypothetical protein TNCV_4971471 [Trichonephila clavipes]